jgi:REP-associated tyrosine transposase
MLTRRCTQRQFLLRPDPEVANAVIYCLAVAAHRFEVDVIDFIHITNHLHEAIYDRHGNGPQFYEYFYGLLAKCVNALRGRWENVFSSEQPSVVTILTTEDLIKRLVYIATNAIKHNLVACVDDWPGASGYRALLNNTPLRATRPKHFFSEKGTMPAEVTLRVGIPPELGDRDVILGEVKARVEEYERTKAAERAQTGQTVLGRYAVLRQPWDASPTSREPRRKLQRTIAAVSKWTRIAALQRKREFPIAHREARVALIEGNPIPFPYGTYWLRRFAGVQVEPPFFLN